MRILILVVISLSLFACKHPLAIDGEGDIIERLFGHRGCTLEEFQANAPRCTDNEAVDEPYQVSYEGVPRPGWRFVGWEGGTGCSPDSVAPYCEYDTAQAWVDYTNLTWPGIEFPATVAVFEKIPLQNNPPVARAGIDQFIYLGAVVVLDGSSSFDPEGAPLTFRWSERSPSGVISTFENLNTPFPSFVASEIGRWVIQLEVYDGELWSEPSILFVDVIAPPIFNNDVHLYSVTTFDVEYLGCWTCNEFDADSIHNDFGTYGSSFSALSIRNRFGNYGGAFSNDSVCNSFASNPPQLWDFNGTEYFGELTINTFAIDGVCNQFSAHYHASSCTVLNFYCQQ